MGGSFLVSPAASLRGMGRMVRTNRPIRGVGAFALALGATMVWAGASEGGSYDLNSQTTLAFIVSLIGWALVGLITPLLVVLPGFCRALTNAFLPSDYEGITPQALKTSLDTRGSLIGWRMMGLVRVVVSGLLIYFGALAL
jgi:hypothetical protein